MTGQLIGEVTAGRATRGRGDGAGSGSARDGGRVARIVTGP
jgi:hypothetical protein